MQKKQQTPFEILWETHLQETEKVKKISAQCPWNQEEFYAAWCAQFFYFVAHATRLLCAAGARYHLDRDALHIRTLDHCQEEKSHEKLLEQDLEYFGYKPSDFKEHPLSAFLYESQYYLIEYHNPVALFGSILFLEGLSLIAGPQIYGEAKKAFGDEACNFLRVHVGEDIGHIEKAKKMLSTLSEHELQVVLKSYEQTAYAFTQILLEIKNKAIYSEKKAA